MLKLFLSVKLLFLMILGMFLSLSYSTFAASKLGGCFLMKVFILVYVWYFVLCYCCVMILYIFCMCLCLILGIVVIFFVVFMKFFGITAYVRLGGFFINFVVVVFVFDMFVFMDGDGFFFVVFFILSVFDCLFFLCNCFVFLRFFRVVLIVVFSAAMFSRRFCFLEIFLGFFNELFWLIVCFFLYIVWNCFVIVICVVIVLFLVFVVICCLNVSEILFSFTGGIACSYSFVVFFFMCIVDFVGSIILNFFFL